MKKIIFVFFTFIFCLPSFGVECIRIKPEVLTELFSSDPEIQTNILNTYLHEIENGQCKHVAAIDAKGLWKLCKAAQIDIKSKDGKSLCENKIEMLLYIAKQVPNKFYPVCDNAKSVPNGASAKCDNRFIFTSVTTTQGILLAKLLQQYRNAGFTDLECSDKFRLTNESNPFSLYSYFLQCYSKIRNTYYEFIFKSLAETDGNIAKQNVLTMINSIFRCTNNTCEVDETDFKNLSAALPELGITNFKTYSSDKYEKYIIEINEDFTPTEIDEESRQKAIAKLSKSDKITLRDEGIINDGIIDFEKLSDSDKEFYKLWKEYAPGNQTFDDFKSMTNGNLDEMKNMAKSWPTRTERNERNYKELLKYNQEREQLQNELDKKTAELEKTLQEIAIYTADDYYENSAKKESDAELKKLYQKRELLAQEIEQANRKLAEQQKPVVLDAAYSTYDLNIAKIGKKVEKLDTKWKTAYATGNDKKFEKVTKKLTKQDIILSEKYEPKNLGNIANDRAQIYADIVNDNPEIKSKITNSENWNQLTIPERLAVAQAISDEYAKRNGGPIVPLHSAKTTDGTIGYTQNGQIFLTDFVLETPNQLLDTLSHEQAHIIDNILPNHGALGAQISTIGNKAYMGEDDYFVAPTEKSSYLIGSTVSEKITGNKTEQENLEITNDHIHQEINYMNAQEQLKSRGK